MNIVCPLLLSPATGGKYPVPSQEPMGHLSLEGHKLGCPTDKSQIWSILFGRDLVATVSWRYGEFQHVLMSFIVIHLNCLHNSNF